MAKKEKNWVKMAVKNFEGNLCQGNHLNNYRSNLPSFISLCNHKSPL